MQTKVWGVLSYYCIRFQEILYVSFISKINSIVIRNVFYICIFNIFNSGDIQKNMMRVWDLYFNLTQLA